MSISKLMTKPVLRIADDATIQEAVEIMGKEDISTLLVTRHGRDVGILTAGDVISKVVAKKKDLDTVRVKDVMSVPLITIDKKMSGEDALRMMVKHDVRRLLITDDDEIVGIFTTSDITKLVP